VREKLILDMLKSKENVCMKSMASMLNVSDRTVRTEINLLNKSGEINGFKVINIRGKGYSLKINDEEKFNKYIKKINSFFESDINFGLEERTNKILEILLISNDYITIDYISEVIGYSRSTIIKDLEENLTLD
jgi:lichenan operon transcriptional antiterminator